MGQTPRQYFCDPCELVYQLVSYGDKLIACLVNSRVQRFRLLDGFCQDDHPSSPAPPSPAEQDHATEGGNDSTPCPEERAGLLALDAQEMLPTFGPGTNIRSCKAASA